MSTRISTISVAVVLAVAVVTAAGCRSASEPIVIDSGPVAISEPAVSPGAADLADIDIELDEVVSGFDQPLFVTGAGDDSGRLFVAEKTGRVWIVADGRRSDTPYLDISGLVSTNSERGLLGLAFAPDFAESGELYVDYTNLEGDTVVARAVTEDPAGDEPPVLEDRAPLLTVEQPYSNHNGGMIAFGPDGFLYIGLGDGGSGGDPEGNGQNTETLLGTIARIAFDDGADRAEIWAYGLRNPWRFSFDRETGDLWIGDVGQNAWEEIDFQRAGSGGGENYGWNVFEATHDFESDSEVTETDVTMPIIEYDRSAGKSVTGGYVYRGAEFPALAGTYFYGDFESGRIWGLQRTEDGVRNRLLVESGMAIVSFGEDDAGEVYVLDFNGALHRIVAR